MRRERMTVLSARNLRNRSGDLFKDAAKGRISLITKHGRPAALAIPFDEALLAEGVHRRLAVQLYASSYLTLAGAAKMADLPVERFLECLRLSKVVVADYPVHEVAAELEVLK
jgi:antitoxin (DNA-binding transcriptional repressor) of toxin-antitoxin stability system